MNFASILDVVIAGGLFGIVFLALFLGLRIVGEQFVPSDGGA